MKKENRIRKNQEFKKIISNRKIVKNNEFKIFYQVNNLGKTRVGISVSSKIGNAVTRNKIKRQIRAILIPIIKINKNIDLVIIVKENFKNNNYINNKNSLNELVKLIYE